MHMKKRKYLHRLIVVMLLGLTIPLVLFFNFFAMSAFKEINRTNEAFYKSSLDSYIKLFDKKLQDLERFAAEISVESKETDSWLLRGQEALSENVYQVYMAIEELEEKYSRSDVGEWGIYFYDIDKIITPEYAYTSDQFIYKYTGESKEFTQCADFFSDENYVVLNTLFDTTNKNNDMYEGHLLVGSCTRIGQNNDRALVFYVLSPKNINDSLTIVGGEGITYSLTDRLTERRLLVWGDVKEKDAKSIGTSGEKNTSNIEGGVLHDLNSRYQQLSVSADISADSFRNNIVEWVLNMRMLLLVIAIILLLLFFLAIYISYKPIYELIRDFDDSDDGEFEMIRNVLDDKNSRIGEQEMLIMDLLINHLIYGVPISEKRIKRLGIADSMQYYCVFLIEGHYFISSAAEKLSDEIKKNCDARIFLTDWQAENCSMVIAFLKEKDIHRVQDSLTQWLEENYVAEETLYTGKVFDKLDDIQLSFRSCLDQMKKKNDKKSKADTSKLEAREEQQKKMKEEILSYLEIHYRDSDLSQMQVADQFLISTYTLSRFFKNQVGVGFAEYLVAKRLEYARELLLTTSYSVREVSIMAGFSSENYFSRTFKLYEGVSPSSFRNKSELSMKE